MESTECTQSVGMVEGTEMVGTVVCTQQVGKAEETQSVGSPVCTLSAGRGCPQFQRVGGACTVGMDGGAHIVSGFSGVQSLVSAVHAQSVGSTA